MSATPRTDSRAFRILSDLQSGTREVVDADLSRTIETELNDAVEARDLAARDAGAYCGTLVLSASQLGCSPEMVDDSVRKLIAERDELRGALALALGYENCNAEYERLREERDQWQLKAEKLAVLVRGFTYGGKSRLNYPTSKS